MKSQEAGFSDFLNQEDVEDYSLRYAPSSYRKWSPAAVASTGLGAAAALFAFAISAVLTNGSGSANALVGNIVAVALCVIAGIPIGRAIATHNVDMDLLTRGAGFGYLGSTITSLIYATFTLIYFAFEGAIMGQGVTGTFGIPLRISYAIVAIVMIPLVTFGMSFLAKLQAWTWPFYIALIVAPIALLGCSGHESLHSWLTYTGLHPASGQPLINDEDIGLAAAALLSLMAQIGEQADYVRFMPTPTNGAPSLGWRFWTFMSGPGWYLIFMVAFASGSYLASYAGQHIGADSNEPFHTFLFIYGQFVPHWMALTCSFLLIVVAQTKINVTNTYSGSLSWSNFFSRLLHRHYGRFTWLILQVAIGLLLMEADVFSGMAKLLDFYSNIAVAWIVAVAADLTINRKLLKIGPSWIEFRRGYLYDFNPVGFGAMIIASAISIACYFHAFGASLAAFAPFVSAVVALICVPLIALITKGKYYLCRQPEMVGLDSYGYPAGSLKASLIECTVCKEAFEPFDTLSCPFHAGTICSLCCTVSATCENLCKQS